jgi:hypothetical protein
MSRQQLGVTYEEKNITVTEMRTLADSSARKGGKVGRSSVPGELSPAFSLQISTCFRGTSFNYDYIYVEFATPALSPSPPPWADGDKECPE